MTYMLITAGCAECRGWDEEPLVEVKGPFDTAEEAKAAGWSPWPDKRSWEDHPQGGWIEHHNQGANWVLPTATLAGTELGEVIP